jgi:hypothetical protein
MKIGWLCLFITTLGAMLLGLTGGLSPALAQIYIIESTAPGIKVGAQLAMADSVSIPAGASVRAVLPSGKTQTVRGPYSGSVADLAKGQEVNEGVVGWLKNILQTGGASEATPGATRSAGVMRPRATPRFSWWQVPTSIDGSVCVGKGTQLQLARAPVPVAQRVAVVDVDSAARGEAEWPVNADLVPWPAGVAIRPGGGYYLLLEGRPRRQVKLEVLDKLPADDDLLAELQKRGCRYQFEAFLREKLAEAKK